MYDLLEDIKNNTNSKETDIKENLCELILNIKIPKLPNFSFFNDLYEKINNDNLNIILQSSTDIAKVLKKTTSQEEYDAFASECGYEEEFEVQFKIDKIVNNGHIKIYNWSAFSAYLNSLSIGKMIDAFNSVIKLNELLFFDVLNDEVDWNTETFYFTSNSNKKIIKDIRNSRSERLKKAKDISNFDNKCNIIPNDFIIVTDYEGNPLTGIFNKISTILAIIYIANNSDIENEKLNSQISGQRIISINSELSKIKYNCELIKIYEWIYKDGNHIDKILLARNIISMHCKFTSILDIDYKTFSSIQSNYGIYLKENVGKYLEVKEEVSKFILEISLKISEDSMFMLSSFKKNIFAVFAFILTVVITDISSSQPVSDILTKDVRELLSLILLGSFFYFIMCLCEIIVKYKNNDNSYKNLKDNYKDIFSAEDFANIFDDNKYKVIKEKIFRGIVLWSVAWLVCLVIAFLSMNGIDLKNSIIKIIKYILTKMT